MLFNNRARKATIYALHLITFRTLLIASV